MWKNKFATSKTIANSYNNHRKFDVIDISVYRKIKG